MGERRRRMLEVRKLTQLVRKGAANKVLLGHGRQFDVFKVSGKGVSAVVKKEKIHGPSGKEYPMTDEEYRKAVERAKGFRREHKAFDKAMGRHRVAPLLGTQMRVDRPGSLLWQREIPVQIQKLHFVKSGKETEAVPLAGAPPRFVSCVLSGIVDHLIIADRKGVALDCHLENWTVKMPRGKKLEEVMHHPNRFPPRVSYVDTAHGIDRRWAQLENSVPVLMDTLKAEYPGQFQRFRRIILRKILQECGKQRASKIAKKFKELEAHGGALNDGGISS